MWWAQACFYKEVFDLLTLCHDIVVYKLYSRTCSGAVQDHTGTHIHIYITKQNKEKIHTHTKIPQVRPVTSLSK